MKESSKALLINILVGTLFGVSFLSIDILLEYYTCSDDTSLYNIFILCTPHERFMRIIGTISFFLMGFFIGKLKSEYRAKAVMYEELSNSKKTLDLAFEESNIGMCMVSLDGKLIKVNKLLSQMSGYSQEELREKTFLDITHPDDIEIGMELFKKMLSGELSNIRFNKRYIAKAGDVILCNVSASMIRSSNGDPQFIIAQLMDITEHRKSENALKEREAFIKKVLDNLPIGIAVNSVDPTVNFEYMNDNFPIFYRTTRPTFNEQVQRQRLLLEFYSPGISWVCC